MSLPDKIKAEPGTPPAAPQNSAQLRRVVISSYLGSTIEYYDFLLYGTAAALVFNRLFFTHLDPLTGVLASFGTFAAGYLARPLGGIVFGHFGDLLGRRSMLLLTMSLMGLASFLIGVLPTYDQIGIWAPVLLVFLRIVQGVSVGGEWGGAALMSVEHAGPQRRGLWASFTQMGAASGMLLSTGALALVSGLPEEQFLAWGWRVPFLFSLVLFAVGLFVRLKVDESPVFDQARQADELVRRPLLEVLARYPRNIVLAAGIGLGAFVLNTVLTAFVAAYAQGAGYTRSEVLAGLTTAAAVSLVGVPLFAALSDRVGRRPVVLGGSLATVVAAFPLFALINSGSTGLFILALVGGTGVLFSAMFGPMAAMFAEMFGTRARYTGASLGYQLAATLGAGFAPLVAGALLAAGGGGTNSGGISLLIAGAALISAVSVWMATETRGADLRS